jgi:ABC-type dipeptide/oligopeptide/nickel transport system permease component
MGRYIGVRLIQASIVLAIVTVLVFVIAQLLAGDAIRRRGRQRRHHDPAVVQRVRDDLGLVCRSSCSSFSGGRFCGRWVASIGGQNV